MKIETEERYGHITILGFNKILKRNQLPDQYIESGLYVFAWNDGRGITIVDKNDDHFRMQIKPGAVMTKAFWTEVVWPKIEAAGTNLTTMLKQNGWKLNKPIKVTYET